MKANKPVPNHRRKLLFLIRAIVVFILVMSGLFLVAHLGMKYHEGFLALRQLMFDGRWYLLAWRCLIYIAIYSGIVWLWKRSVLKQMPLKPVYRLAGAFTLFIAVNEISVWTGEISV